MISFGLSVAGVRVKLHQDSCILAMRSGMPRGMVGVMVMSDGRSVTVVQTEISQQLLGGLHEIVQQIHGSQRINPSFHPVPSAGKRVCLSSEIS